MIHNILVITTGGTIDAKAVDGAPPEFITPENSNRAFAALTQIQKKQSDEWKKKADLKQIKLTDKDSKNITPQDINAMAEHIGKSRVDRIIVTMGTDRMCELAALLKNKIETPPCPVVFTGAMIPLANGPNVSDGYVNLELAAFGYPSVPAGIYICGNDIFMPAQYVTKNFEKRRFELKPDAPVLPFAK